MPPRSSIRSASLAVIALAGIGLAACSGAAREQVVARVGSNAITHRTLTRWMAALAPEHVVPDAPRYTACVKRQQALALAQASSAAMKQECAQQYRALEQQALDLLISSQWLLGEAAARHLTVSGRELNARLSDRASVARLAGAPGADAEAQARAELSAVKLRQAVEAGEPRITRAQVATYYRQHRQLFERPEVRYLDVVENLTAAGAARVRREVLAGAYGLAARSLHEVIEGFDIVGGRHTTQAARRAIFAAKPHVLSQPVKLNKYYAVFEVTRIVPPRRQPLARVERSLQARLEREQRKRELAQLIAAWRRTWIARTDCAPGYTVQKCRQYTGTRVPEDPLAFD